MPAKKRYFLSAAILLATLAIEKSASADANLAVGETRLPSGVVVRINNAASSPEEYLRNLEEKIGTTPEARGLNAFEAIRRSASQDRIDVKLEIVDAFGRTTTSICEEYIVYLVKPFTLEFFPYLRKIEVDITDQSERAYKQKCPFKVDKNHKISRENRSKLPDIELKTLNIDNSNFINIASLGEENSVFFKLPLMQTLIVVPFLTTNTLDLTPLLTIAAKKLYLMPDSSAKNIRLVVAAKGVDQDKYSLPSEFVIAFQTTSGSILFVEDLGLQLGKDFRVITISVWSPPLTQATLAGLDSKELKNFISESAYREAFESFDIAVRYAADLFKVSMVVLIEKTLPGSAVDFGFPVLFELYNGKWVIAGSHK